MYTHAHAHAHAHAHTHTQDFPPYPPAPFSAVVPTLSEQGVDLLKRHLVRYPNGRISSEDAMRHEYFVDVDPAVKA